MNSTFSDTYDYSELAEDSDWYYSKSDATTSGRKTAANHLQRNCGRLIVARRIRPVRWTFLAARIAQAYYSSLKFAPGASSDVVKLRKVCRQILNTNWPVSWKISRQAILDAVASAKHLQQTTIERIPWVDEVMWALSYLIIVRYNKRNRAPFTGRVAVSYKV